MLLTCSCNGSSGWLLWDRHLKWWRFTWYKWRWCWCLCAGWYQVRRCDHGNILKLHVSNLRPLPSSLIGSVALECTLSDIRWHTHFLTLMLHFERWTEMIKVLKKKLTLFVVELIKIRCTYFTFSSQPVHFCVVSEYNFVCLLHYDGFFCFLFPHWSLLLLFSHFQASRRPNNLDRYSLWPNLLLPHRSLGCDQHQGLSSPRNYLFIYIRLLFL